MTAALRQLWPATGGRRAREGTGTHSDLPAASLATRAVRRRRRVVAARAVRRVQGGWQPAVASSLSLLALALFAFVMNVTVISAVEHARSQRVAYAELREQLSAVTAPVGQVDAAGQLLALGTPVAYLTIPGLGLEREVVFEGTTAQVLTKGPGHRRSSVLPGQAGVAILYGRGWSHGGPFGGAADLSVGAPITVTTGQGEHSYRVTGVRKDGSPIPPPPNASQGGGRLTLVTAVGAPFAPAGTVYVDADLTSTAAVAAPRVLGAAGLLPSEEALASDRTAWPAVALMLQALALCSVAIAVATRRWGRSQAWLVGVPVLALTAVLASRQVMRLLPNLL